MVAVSCAVLLFACSGGIVTSETDGGASGAASPSTPATAAGQPVDLTDVQSIEVGAAFCGAAPGECHGTHSTTVDFAAATVTSSACSDGDAGPPPARALAPADAERVRAALAAVRYSNAISQAEDGQMQVLQITRPSAKELYSPEATCDQGEYRTIESGFMELSSIVWSL